LVLAVVIILVNFGLWQLRRLEQRRALNRDILAGLSQPPATLTGANVDPDALHFRRVSVTGTFDNAEGIVLRGRSLNSRPGAELVVPLRIKGTERAVLVNRGWIPLESSTLEERRLYDVEEEVAIEGIAYRTQTRPDSYFAPTDPTPKPGEGRLDAWFRVDIERIQEQVSYPLLPVFIEQSPDPEANAPPFSTENLDLSEGPHLGYALQWFSFAIILVIIYAAFTWQELR
jgi:surfeit locus 1 family protein